MKTAVAGPVLTAVNSFLVWSLHGIGLKNRQQEWFQLIFLANQINIIHPKKSYSASGKQVIGSTIEMNNFILFLTILTWR